MAGETLKSKKEVPQDIIRNWPKVEQELTKTPLAAKSSIGAANLCAIRYESEWSKQSIEAITRKYGDTYNALRHLLENDFFKGPDGERRIAMALAYASLEGIEKTEIDLKSLRPGADVSELVSKARNPDTKLHLEVLNARMQREV